MRFVGQAFELSVAVDEAELPGLDAGFLMSRFLDVYRRHYAHADSLAIPAEIVALRLRLTVARGTDVTAMAIGEAEGTERIVECFEMGQQHSCRLRSRGGLAAGSLFPGPLLLTDATASTFVPDGWTAQADPSGHVFLNRQ